MASKAQDCRAMGEARIEVARVAKTPMDWKRLWKKPAHEWAIRWGTCWKACFEYRVTDFAAEVGMFVDVLGFPTNAFGPDYAMFTSPEKDFYFSVVKAKAGEKPTPADAVHLQFMVEDLFGLAKEFEARGVVFEQAPTSHEGSPIYSATFRTPNGIPVDLWGMVDPKTTIRRKPEGAKKVKVGAR
ncbi:MAG: VOC family protein [Candidatus Brocadiae bacterium]|nr:VOC family protein [Candidatus Brocadiia bacterium]